MRRSRKTPFTIVVGVDFSETSERALAEALDLADDRRPTDLHLVSVVDEASRRQPADQAESAAEALARTTEEQLKAFADRVMGADVRSRGHLPIERRMLHVRVGLPADEIVKLSADFDADLIVVGTHGRRGLSRMLLGSVAERTLRLAQVPVLVVRPTPEREPLPEPDKPCRECIATRRRTGGTTWWCDVHALPHERPHAYSYSQEIPFRRSDLGG